MELFQFFDKYYLSSDVGLDIRWVVLCGVLMCLFLIGSVIHRPPLSIKDKISANTAVDEYC